MSFEINLKIEDCIAATQNTEAKNNREKRRLYLIQILSCKNFILEGLKYGLEISYLYDTLKEHQAVSMPYVTFSRLIRKKIINADSVEQWRIESFASHNAGNNSDTALAKQVQISKTKASANAVKNNIPKKDVISKTDKSQSDNTQKKQFKFPSFDNWDGDSTKFIDEWIGN